MIIPPEVPPVIHPRRAITYRLTRWDLVLNFVTVLFRNRITRVLFPVFVVLNVAIILGPGLKARPLWLTAIEALLFVVGFTGIMLVSLLCVGLMVAFLLKQRGVVGEHVLEVTEQGPVERTEFNETLHKWGAICRITSMTGYLYIHVSDMNSHQIPKRRFPRHELAALETDIRARAYLLKSQ
jgi:hypothetical protein